MDPRMWHKVAALSGCIWNSCFAKQKEVTKFSLVSTHLHSYKVTAEQNAECTKHSKFSVVAMEIKDTVSPSVQGVAALALGTYGAHAFKPQNPDYKDVWHTASLYHLVHTAALLAAPITKHPNIFGGFLTTGILAFSGTCYTVAFLEDRKYSFLAPFGGFAFIGGWASLLL